MNIGDEGGVEVCDGCGGALLDFFDGEPTALARQLAEHAQRFSKEESRSQATLSCSECEVPMTTAPYMAQGPTLSRCARCLCIFVSAGELLALAHFQQVEAEAEPPTWLERLAAALRSVMGADDNSSA